jgi:hypothetical protein
MADFLKKCITKQYRDSLIVFWVEYYGRDMVDKALKLERKK